VLIMRIYPTRCLMDVLPRVPDINDADRHWQLLGYPLVDPFGRIRHPEQMLGLARFHRHRRTTQPRHKAIARLQVRTPVLVPTIAELVGLEFLPALMRRVDHCSVATAHNILAGLYAPASGIRRGDVVLSKEISHAKWTRYGERTRGNNSLITTGQRIGASQFYGPQLES